jgi:hypothetical protein
MGLIFTFAHALGLLTGILLHQPHWRLLMQIGVAVTFVASTAFIWIDPAFIPLLCGVLGIFAALMVLGWSYLFSVVLISNRLGRMALIIMTANLFLTGVTILVDRLTAPAVFIIVNIPLALAAALIFTIKSPLPKAPLTNPTAPTTVFPQKLLLYLCLAIFGLFLSGGFMYNGILPYYQQTLLWNCFPELIYILTLMFIWKFCPKKELTSLVYYSLSLLGWDLSLLWSLKTIPPAFFNHCLNLRGPRIFGCLPLDNLGDDLRSLPSTLQGLRSGAGSQFTGALLWGSNCPSFFRPV